MTRDETVALFEACEAKRAEARAAALSDGKTEDEARAIAHEAAKAHWNAWAEPLLAQRKAMEEAGAWKSARAYYWEPEKGENPKTQAWLEKATADFSRCLFLLRGVDGTKETAGEDKVGDADSGPPIKSIQLEGDRADFSGFVFPGDASFNSATFSGGAWFGSATFTGNARFASTTFSGTARFERTTFSGTARFASATFSGDAWFKSTTFSGTAWFASATFSGDAWFESATFSGTAWFASATFTGTARFESTTFTGTAWFASATFSGDARFDSATFSGDAWFASATFSGDARFASATFSADARFERTTFTGNTRFASAAFSGDARFGSATFSGGTSFESAAFSGDARFGSATFSGDASFESAAFSGNARFKSAAFQNFTNYREATFEKKASFEGIKVDRAFGMTGAAFKQVPAFNQADFKQAPDLDDVRFPLPFFWGDAELIARYRAIRRMAIQGADYEREQMAFKGELRSRRWTTDKWRHFGTWFGLLYDGLADCGRSIVRPFWIWLASVPVFAVLYLRLADQPEGFGCGTPFVKALFLSGRNALVLFSGGRDARIAQAYRCLYGGDGEPQIPDSVSFLEAFVQVPLSAVLIFLLLLAVKNRFKIK